MTFARLLLIFILFLFACRAETPQENVEKTYLHLAHTRTNKNPKMDSIVESIDYKKFDMLLLGGDLAKSTSMGETTMRRVDSIFDLSNTNTLWSLGNHDYKDLERVKRYTKRQNYYAYHKNDITFLVLDSQDSLSHIVNKQKDFFHRVTDTLSKSSHLVVLHHKILWMYGHPDLEPKINKISNGNLGSLFYSLNPNNFYQDIYPELVKIQQKGIQVICIAGDIGHKVSEFQYRTSEGIQFLASGIEYTKPHKNKALLFKHNPKLKTLKWDYIMLSDLD